MVPHYTMDPNTGYPAGYPVPTQSPQNQQMPFYPNAVPPYPQSKTPSAQHFGAMPMQPGPGGAMMPSGFQQSSGSLPPLPLFLVIIIGTAHLSLLPGGVELLLKFLERKGSHEAQDRIELFPLEPTPSCHPSLWPGLDKLAVPLSPLALSGFDYLSPIYCCLLSRSFYFVGIT